MQVDLTTAIQPFEPVGAPAINAPFVRFATVDVGGDGGTVFCTVCLDPQEAWPYGIAENGRMMKFAFQDGKVEAIVNLARQADQPKFRKCKGETPEKAVAAINRYIAKLAA